MKKALKKLRHSLAPVLIAALKAVFFFVPLRAASAAGGALGGALFNALKKEREIIYRNLDIVWPGKFTQKRKAEFALANFRHYGTVLFEFLKISAGGIKTVRKLTGKIHGLEHFEKAAAQKKGVIAVTAHFGNWELIPLALKDKGYNIGVIGKKLFSESLDKQLNSARTATGVKVFERDSLSKEMIKELKNGMMLGILADHDTRGENVTVPFLGINAKTPAMPAKLAKKYGLLMCTIFITRAKDGLYDITINPFIKNLETRHEADIMAECSDEISKAVKTAPEQWSWAHDRYKSMNTVNN